MANGFDIARQKGLSPIQVPVRPDQRYFLDLLCSRASLEQGRKVQLGEILRGIIDTYIENTTTKVVKKKK